MSAEFNIHEAKTHLSRLLERVAAGERITISRAGRPIADLVPHQRSSVRIGGLSDRIRYDDADFDDPDPDIQRMFYGARDDDDAPAR
ncbi:type II toxin-antitoxin system Phd/YefM family antitoxin [Pseudonocardia parietis]|uniref:Antitoxin n=1 Tax=Pseudonocardia parietis TaxID=570936 RepID=A0ABS4VM74_9PSEU|nr:type II toxin-antitoxin system prevent-host-death family antitoxin [Pseudonocardia parietis]MBP2364674.1 prevent-host-death family protein [Pseudonocardia parietis]